MNTISKVKGFFGKHLLTKEWLNDNDPLIEARKQKCYKCPNYDRNNDSCKICKCIIGVKSESKVNINPFELRLEDTHCPVGKWPIVFEDGKIGGNDLLIANYYRELSGKGRINRD